MPAAIAPSFSRAFTISTIRKACRGWKLSQQELCAASINRDGEQHRVQKVEAQLMHVFFTVRVDVYKTVACNEKESVESVRSVCDFSF